jgi:UDP-N-acetylbacillosamine N-acetyltransferase
MNLTESAKEVVIWGAGGHSKVIAEILRLQGAWHIVGFIDDVNIERAGDAFCGSKILGPSSRLADLYELGVKHLALGVGDCKARLRMLSSGVTTNFTLVTAIHPSAIVSKASEVESGAAIAAGAVVGPEATIGRGAIINTSATVDHECVVADAAHICPGVHLAGRVCVGRGAWIGIGAVVIEGLNIGEGALIGAGSVVVSNIPEKAVAYGVPARIIRRNE